MAKPARELAVHEPEPVARFRVAAIDVGSNGIRLLVAEFGQGAGYEVLAQERLPVRLGHEVFLSGRLAADTMDRAVRGLAEFRRQIDTLGGRRYRAVATSAVRESDNADAFVERVRDEAEIDLEVITGAEESRLVYLAARHRVPLGRRRWILVDLGGGSVEVMLVDGTGILWSESHTMGAVRLLEELRLAGDAPDRVQRLVSEYATTLRVDDVARRWKAGGFIATGGNAEALARIAGAEPDARGVSRLSLQTLRALRQKLGTMSFAERMQQFKLREDRADVIVPGAFIYERLCTAAGADVVVVPNVGVKDGIVLDLAADIVAPRQHVDQQDRETLAAALTLGRRYLFEEAHAAHVGRLAVSLFDQLRELHGLGDRERRMLLTAALLHDIGLFVSHKRHHKHAAYLIQNSEVGDFTAAEMAIVGNIARYHRKGAPSDGHEDFQRLPHADRARVAALSALLRLADALDREHRQQVRAVRAEVHGDELRLVAEASGDLLLERWALERKADLFHDLYGLRVSLVVNSAAD